MKKSEIQIRDPFILPIPEKGIYFMYGTTDLNCWNGKATGFNAYKSKDLEDWTGPFPVFTPGSDFWADMNFWAPEVHIYKGKYYMFASFKAEGVCRGTQILVSEVPEGPFTPLIEKPVTPSDWECLDGTFYLDENGVPWIIFCHEWLQVHDGEICALRLSEDLKFAVGKPHVLFTATQARWPSKIEDFGTIGYVTDGPFLYKAQNGDLLIIWSSYKDGDYAIATARSTSGTISGVWKHDPTTLFEKDGGHGMIFKSFDGRLFLTIHTPNNTPDERPIFLELHEHDGQLLIK